MTNEWNKGPIYCSAITKILLLDKFPDLERDNITGKQLNFTVVRYKVLKLN